MIEKDNIYYTNYGYGKLVKNNDNRNNVFIELDLFWGSKLYTVKTNIRKFIKINIKPFLSCNRKIEMIEVSIFSTFEELINQFIKLNNYEYQYIINIQLFHLKGKIKKIDDYKKRFYDLNIKDNEKIFLFGEITFQLNEKLKSDYIKVI